MNRDSGPLQPFWEHQDILILDGGLATELEARGHDLSDRLWSARLLAECPEAIQEVHAAYLAAGADCIIGAGYQATLPGFAARGFSPAEARALLRRSVTLALQAREAFWEVAANGAGGLRPRRLRPLVAAGIGPYGAYLADGSEYTGRYDLSPHALRAFHEERFRLLAASDADLLACETIPSAAEAAVLAELLGESTGAHAWISFSCRDDERIADGTPLVDAARAVVGTPGLVAIGVNCTAPQFIPGLLNRLRQVTDLPLVAYPNSGERYAAETGRWAGAGSDLAAACPAWRAAGARLIGGCCRTTPATIQALRRALLAQTGPG